MRGIVAPRRNRTIHPGTVAKSGSQRSHPRISRIAARERPSGNAERDRWLEMPFTGVDGAPKTGQAWVRSGWLTATVFTPPNAGTAVEVMFEGLEHGKVPPERVLIQPSSLPKLDQLGR